MKLLLGAFLRSCYMQCR